MKAPRIPHMSINYIKLFWHNLYTENYKSSIFKEVLWKNRIFINAF
jgi:hypothetical protein